MLRLQPRFRAATADGGEPDGAPLRDGQRERRPDDLSSAFAVRAVEGKWRPPTVTQ
jgi:hypothetical protein